MDDNKTEQKIYNLTKKYEKYRDLQEKILVKEIGKEEYQADIMAYASTPDVRSRKHGVRTRRMIDRIKDPTKASLINDIIDSAKNKKDEIKAKATLVNLNIKKEIKKIVDNMNGKAFRSDGSNNTDSKGKNGKGGYSKGKNGKGGHERY